MHVCCPAKLGPMGPQLPLTRMLLYMLPLSTSRLTRMMQQSPTCWLYRGSEEL